MMGKTSTSILWRGLIFSGVVLVAAAFSSEALGQEPVAMMTASQGDVSISRLSPELSRALPVRESVRKRLFTGDVVKTGPGAKAKLMLSDDSLIVLNEDTELEIDQVFLEPATGRRFTKVRVLQGVVRAAFQPTDTLEPEYRFTIETPAATVATRGAGEGIIKVSEGRMKKVTFWSLTNTWEVNSTDPAVSGVVRIPPRHYTEVALGELPGEPRPTLQADLMELRRATTLMETALTRPTPATDLGDTIYQTGYYASRARRSKTWAASAPSKKALTGYSKGQENSGALLAGTFGPIFSHSASLVEALQQGLMAVFNQSRE